MSRKKTGLLIFAIAFLAIQFIQPSRNQSAKVLASDMVNTYPVPANIHGLLKNSCFDCHSNNTRYPWYSNLQPAAWWLASHIKEGKSELNFNEFGDYSLRRQRSKLKAIVGSVRDGSMPLGSYALIHQKAKLSKEQKELIIAWAERIQDSISKNER